MSEASEIITLAFGNYSTLIASQWANGTSQYDLNHDTLYTSRQPHAVFGGSPSKSDGRVRVPRLLMLDAPHGVRLEELNSYLHRQKQQMEEKKEKCNTHDEDEEGEGGCLGAHVREDKEEEMLDRSPWEWRRENKEWGDEEENEENEEDPSAEGDETISAATLRRIFHQKDVVTPWWQFIRSGIAKESIITMRPLEQLDAVSSLSACHSFGFGLQHLQSESQAMEMFIDGLRRQLEEADHIQGVQCFVDADSIFGGAAHNTLQTFWEDLAGPKTPAVLIANYQPLPSCWTDPSTQHLLPFALQRRQERHLNRLLATSRLSDHDASILVPLEMEQWGDYFSRTSFSDPSTNLSWLEDDRSTAQLIATLTDTALYGARDGGLFAGDANSDVTYRHSTRLFGLDEWQRTCRPVRALRVAAMLGALPIPVRPSSGKLSKVGWKDLWGCLEDTPLLGHTASAATAALLASTSNPPTPKPPVYPGFVPLTHDFSHSPFEDSGRVLGHAVSLRGPGILPSAVYPAREAMLRYAMGLRTSTYLPYLDGMSAPISNTFPLSLMFGEVDEESKDPAIRDLLREKLGGVDVGAHVVNSYASAPMLQRTIEEAQKILLPSHHCPHLHSYNDVYGMDADNWAETLEDVQQIFDDYNHEVPSDSDE